METYNLTNEQRLQNAQRRVKRIKGFYIHAIVYLCVNLFIIAGNAYEGINNLYHSDTYMTAIFWGFGLLAHGLSVFAPSYILGKNWEERKIQEILNEK